MIPIIEAMDCDTFMFKYSVNDGDFVLEKVNGKWVRIKGNCNPNNYADMKE